MNHQLKSGTILDGRYRVDKVLGEGGFGITYAAENVRIGLKVAVKEFFWHGHMTRDTDQSLTASIINESDRDLFLAQKQRFLKEGRTLRDFSHLNGIAHILDSFEENGTVYIVIEYVEGVTLERFLSDHDGQMDPEIILRRMLPLIDSLDTIHNTGVIHRDISPDNIMVMPDGRLRLIDFGAARQLTLDEARSAAIAKACYTPCEQYDKNGRQGPWTDVYALCATLYRCVTGAPPESAIQRMFLDELRTPSQMGANIKPEYEAIIMKGLQVDAEKRYQTMQALGSAIRSALPEEKKHHSTDRRRLAVSFAAGAIFLAALLCAWLFAREYTSNKFRGIVTERLRLSASSDMTAAEFADAQVAVRKWLEHFAGHNNYIMSVDGVHINITVPLSIYEDREIVPTTAESFDDFIGPDEKDSWTLKLSAEIKANWEDPATSLIAGKNQVLPDVFDEETLVFTYDWTYTLTPGQRANMIVDFKTRLDALDVPYAFGTLYGNDNEMVFCLPPRRIGRAILDMLGNNTLYLSGESRWIRSVSLSYNDSIGGSALTPFESKDAARGFRYQRQYDSNTDLESLTRTLLQNGEHKVYLRTYAGYNLGEATIDAPILDGRLDITTISLTDFDPADAENAWLFRFVDTVLNRTNLPTNCYIRARGVRGADGSQLFGEDTADHFGVYTRVTEGESALQQTLLRIEEEEGIQVSHWFDSYLSSYYGINLDLEPNEALVENVSRILPALIEKYSLKDCRMEPSLFILLISEKSGERCRIILDHKLDYDTGEIYPDMSAIFNAEGRVAACQEALEAWWEDFDAGALGYRKTNY